MRLLWRRRPAGKPDHELIWLAVSVAAIAGAAAWFALALPWPKCPFRALTGLPCFTCGTTRSMLEFLRGNLPGAWAWNPLACLAFISLVVFDVYAAIVLIGRTVRLRIVDWTVTEKNGARIAVIVLCLLNWIYLLAHRDRY